MDYSEITVADRGPVTMEDTLPTRISGSDPVFRPAALPEGA